jgi:hypothetical protein
MLRCGVVCCQLWSVKHPSLSCGSVVACHGRFGWPGWRLLDIIVPVWDVVKASHTSRRAQNCIRCENISYYTPWNMYGWIFSVLGLFCKKRMKLTLNGRIVSACLFCETSGRISIKFSIRGLGPYQFVGRISILISKLAVGCSRQVSGSNLGQDTDCPDTTATTPSSKHPITTFQRDLLFALFQHNFLKRLV